LWQTWPRGRYGSAKIVVARGSEVLFEELRDARSDRVTVRAHRIGINVPMWLSARSLCMTLITSRGDDCPYRPYLLGSPGSPARSRSSATACYGSTGTSRAYSATTGDRSNLRKCVTMVPPLARPEASTGTRGSPYDDDASMFEPSSLFAAWGLTLPFPLNTKVKTVSMYYQRQP